MSEVRATANGPHAGQISADQIPGFLASLDEEAKKTLAAQLVSDKDVPDEARMAAVTNAVQTATDEAKHDLLAAAVDVAPPKPRRPPQPKR